MKATIVLVALASLLVLAAAQVPKVYIRNPGPFTIGKGFSQNFTFSLDEPILCEDPHVYCAVVILLTNPNTKDLTLDTCQVKWTNADWFVPRVVNVKANENFVDDGMKTYTIITKPVISASEYYNDFNPVDLVLKTQSRPSGSCSATGDPHYTTFDGYYWHEYGPGQNVLYKAEWRDFEIQARVYSRPALHCALAAREGIDAFYINRCPGDAGDVVLNFNSPKDKQPIVSLSGNRYTVSFRSGAQLIFDVASYYMNVYVTAPGMDYNKVTGMCGNWNGNAGDDAAAYVVHDHSGLLSSQIPKTDLWAWKYNPSAASSATIPPFASECAYVAPVVSKPVLAQGDSEDITEILKSIKVQATNKPLNSFQFEDTPIETDVTFATMSEATILKVCTDEIANSDLGKVCAVATGINVQSYVDNCIIDIKTMAGDTRFVTDAFNAMQAACAEIAGRDLSTYVVDENGNLIPNPEITKNLCPNGCSGHGTCSNGICTCDAGFKNSDCSHDSSIAPTVTATVPVSCDAQYPNACPAQISVIGTNFFKDATLACHFGSIVTTATFVSPTKVLCTLPANSADRTAVYQQTVTVTNDGTLFSTEVVKFTWFDSVCNVCDNKGVCQKNANSCIIDGVCYHAQDLNADNACLACKPATSVSAWSYDYSDYSACGPAFEESQYTVNILDVTKANTALIQVHAGNKRVDADTTNKVTYSIGANSNGLLKVDPNTGVVSTVSDINPATINFQTFNARVVLVATDSHNNVVSSNLLITFQGTNRAPVFDQSSYTFTITENSALNLVLGSVKATDPNVGQADAASFGWDKFTYAWMIQEINFGDFFAVNNASGVVTNAKNIDYEAKSVFHLTVRAMDGGGMFSTADVTINVVNVNEAPTSVTLSSSTIAENNAVNDVVGVLTAVDPDANDTPTFSLRTTGVPFAVVANKLVATAVLNFEASPNTFALVVRTADSQGLFVDTTVSVSVTDVNEAPEAPTLVALVPQVIITGNKITMKEDFPVQTPLASVSSSDPDAGQTVACAIVGSSNFQVSGNRVILSAPLDFETAPALSFKVACSDTGIPSKTSTFTSVTVAVADSNEGAQQVQLVSDVVVPENAGVDVVVGQISAVDPDSDATTLSFSTSASDHFKFSVDTPTCEALETGGKKCTATLLVRGGLDFETKPIDVCEVITVDNHGLKTVSPVSIKISDINEAPVGVDLSSNLVEEGAATGTIVGSVLVVDTDATASSYTVVLTDSASGRFALAKRSGARRSSNDAGFDLVVADGSRIDFETSSQLTVGFTVTDNGTPAYTASFTVALTVTDKAMYPVFSVSSVNQNFVVGRRVGVASLAALDRVDLVPAYKLVGTDASFFTASYDSATRTANLILAKPLSTLTLPRSLSFTVVAAFNGDIMAPVQADFTVAITAVNEAPVITSVIPLIYVLKDAALGSALATVEATDAENSPLSYSIVSVTPVSGSSLFVIDATTGVLTTAVVPSTASIPLATFAVTVAVSDGTAQVTTVVNTQVVDNCFVMPDAFPPCNDAGQCVDGFMSYTCICDDGVTGERCDEIIVGGPAASSAATGLTTGATTGLAVGIIVAVILVVFIVLIVIRARTSQKAAPIASVDGEAQAVVFNATESFYAEANCVAPAVDEGLENPIYAWYQPGMSRQQTEEYLLSQQEGAFVIRDSAFTPGWHMLAVRTSDDVSHERIKLNGDGTYQMLPSTNVPQPSFHALPDLIEHYASCKRTGVSFSLALDNPLYDNHLLREQPHTVRPLDTIYEADAPLVPVRDRDREQLDSLAAADAGNDMYLNTAEAKHMLSSA